MDKRGAFLTPFPVCLIVLQRDGVGDEVGWIDQSGDLERHDEISGIGVDTLRTYIGSIEYAPCCISVGEEAEV